MLRTLGCCRFPRGCCSAVVEVSRLAGSSLRFLALLLPAVLDSAAERKACSWYAHKQMPTARHTVVGWRTTAVMQGALAGKTGGYFFSTATQNGGQETTALTGACAPPAPPRRSIR